MGRDTKYGLYFIPNEPRGIEEPLFIIRGKDICAPAAIHGYALIAEQLGATEEFIEECKERAKEIRNWQKENSDVVKVPD